MQGEITPKILNYGRKVYVNFGGGPGQLPRVPRGEGANLTAQQQSRSASVGVLVERPSSKFSPRNTHPTYQSNSDEGLIQEGVTDFYLNNLVHHTEKEGEGRGKGQLQVEQLSLPQPWASYAHTTSLLRGIVTT